MTMAVDVESQSEELLKAIRLVLKDDGFNVPSQSARNAVKSAEALLEWSGEQENKESLSRFATYLLTELGKCFSGPPAAPRVFRERMWGKYFELRTCAELKLKWKEFLAASIGIGSSPTFYQYVTNAVMENVIKTRLVVMEEEDLSCTHTVTLNFEEKNALRYTAGYVFRALKKKLKKSSNPSKQELVLCLEELLGEEADEESHAWVTLIDRGGLNHVNDVTYMLFCAMELKLREVLAKNVKEGKDKLMESAKEEILEDDDFLFTWSILSVNWEEEESTLLMGLIVDHWITLRGFSHASSFMEKYKQDNKKVVQKSKGLRKQIVPNCNN